MFVSSYSTYIDTTVAKRVQNEKSAFPTQKESSFTSKLLTSTQASPVFSSKLPVNYISNYKALSNRLELERQESKNTTPVLKFSKLSAQSSSKVSYEENSKMFSFIIKPRGTIDQTPRLDKNLPTKAQEKQESFMKLKMVNAYIANDNYYNITAA